MISGRVVKKSDKRKKIGILYGFLIVVVVILCLIFATSMVFKVKNIEVAGNVKYSAEEIKDACDIKIGNNLFLINKFSSINKMFKEMPYLKEIQIRRRYPDTIVINITERTPSGNVNGLIIDGDSIVIDRLTDKQVTFVRGFEVDMEASKLGEPLAGSAEKLPLLKAFMKTAADLEITGKIRMLDMTEIYNIKFEYDNRIVVDLGIVEDMEMKIKQFDQVVKMLNPEDTGNIDMSNEKIKFTMGEFEPIG